MVSICIPTYNKPNGLRRLLNSIEQQTYTDIEIIISDDTPDAKVIQRVITDYPQLRIRYYHHDTPLGSPENWNFAYDKAEGEYVKLMHDDDWFSEEEALEKMVNYSHEGKFVFCQSKDIDAKGNMVYQNIPTIEYVEHELVHPARLLVNNWIGAPSCVLHHQIDLRYDKHLKWFVDVDFYIMQMKQLKNRISYVPKSLVNIGVEGNRVTNECIMNMEVIGSEYFYCMKKYRRLHILSLTEYSYLTYCFIRDYRLKSFEDLKPYCNTLLGKVIFWVYKMRRL